VAVLNISAVSRPGVKVNRTAAKLNARSASMMDIITSPES
jgi:hypothetical protein